MSKVPANAVAATEICHKRRRAGEMLRALSCIFVLFVVNFFFLFQFADNYTCRIELSF